MWEDNKNTQNNEPTYSFWADQIAGSPKAQETKEHDSVSYQPPVPAVQTVTELPKRKNSRLKRGIGLLASALVFGLIASASFLGFNKVYYYYNPQAKPVNTTASKDPLNASLHLDPPSGGTKLATTTVSNGNVMQGTDVSAIVDSTMPATVSITSTFQVTSYFFGRSYEEESEGGGSGIIIGENDTEYLIATNHHVVGGASSIQVAFIDDSKATAYIKGSDTDADLAVIAVKKADLSDSSVNAIAIAKLGDSDEVKVGQMVIAIGNALGYGQSVTVGYVSAKDREITNSDTGSNLTVLQVDAAINPGNSGGALLNVKGEVIGINSAKVAGTKVEGIGYAIPITKALPIVSDLMNREVLSDEDKGYLGIYLTDMTDVTKDIAEAYNWPIGVYIRQMTEGSAAEKAGILTGDIITAVNGVGITTKEQLREKVTSYRHGTIVTITIMRHEGNKFVEKEIEVTLSKISTATDNQSQPENDVKSNIPEESQDGSTKDSNPFKGIPEDSSPDQNNPNDNNSDYENEIEEFFNDFFQFGF